MLHLPGIYYVKKPKRFVILCSDKSSERNLSCFFDIRKPRKMEHLHKEEPFSSDPYFSCNAHLGHIFQDRRTSTGKKYCMNVAYLSFNPDSKSVKKYKGKSRYELCQEPETKVMAFKYYNE